MSRERAKILQMVADGTITPEEAEKLLGRLDPEANGPDAPEPDAEPERGEGAERKAGALKYLRIVVNGGDDKINVRVPIGLIRTGIKLSTLMPSSASEHLSEAGIDLSQFSHLDYDELVEALRELKVDVDSEDGETIRIFCE